MSPQTGLPHNNRVGDFDPFAIPLIMQAEGLSLHQVLDTLAEKSGCLGLSGISGDIRDLEEAAAQGKARAQTGPRRVRRRNSPALGRNARLSWAASTRSCSPAASARTASDIRAGVCAGLEELGIVLDPALNAKAKGEFRVSRDEQPRASLDGADQRRIDRGPANEAHVGICLTLTLTTDQPCSSPKSPARSFRRKRSRR